MRVFISEYGLIALTIICLGCFFFIWGYIFFGDNGIETVYSTWKPNVETVTTNGDVVSSVSSSKDKVPFFSIDNNKSFVIETDKYTKANFLSGISAKVENGTNLSDITVIVYKYSPLIIDEIYGVNGHVVMANEYADKYGYEELENLDRTGKYTEVFATDKYGNYIYDSEGKKVVSNQPIYRISKGKVLGANNYIDTSDSSAKYKVTYRVKQGVFKAEYEAFFIKKRYSSGEPAENLTGYTKVEFDYDIDSEPSRT